MKLYEKFRNSSLDTTPVGLYSGADESGSVYTPSGSRIVAWTGTEGIHFCQTEGFGGTVFVVDPTAPPGDCVHPVAASLLDFVGLLIACMDAELIAQSYQWSRSRFEKLTGAIRPSMKMRSVLRALENTYHPPLIRDAYGYIAQQQNSFDYTSLPLHPNYFEWCPIRPGTPKWEVGFGTGFADYCEKGKAGQELPVKKNFLWHGENWCVPAIYLCENGIVVDSYLEVPGQAIDRFLEKWSGRMTEAMSIEEKMRCKLDDPLDLAVKGELIVNGKGAPLRKTYIQQWNPRFDNNWNTRRTLEHYGLDREKGYLLRRECFMRKGKNPPIRTMELLMQAEPVSVPGQRFVAPKSGESLSFVHPVSNQTHTLTVNAQVREALDPNFLSNHPCCYTRLAFSVEPHISRDWFSVVDCDPGDQSDGPAAVQFTGKIPSGGHCAVSSLRFTPAEQITWRMVFRQKIREDVSVPLLP